MTRRRRWRGWWAAYALCAAACWARAAAGHPAQFTTLQVKVEATGEYQASLNVDILAYALGKTSRDSTNDELAAALASPRPALARLLADAGERFRRETVVHTDAGDAVPDAWQLPDLAAVDAVLARKIQPPINMPGEIDFSGTLPPGARAVSIRLPYVLGDTVQVFELPGGRGHDEPVAAGEYSSALELDLAPPGLASRAADFERYVAVGFRHIVPGGLDHILFVLGLFLLSTRLGALLWQVSAFTLAHSITLGLSIYGVIRLPPSVTEPLIAASIACVAVENLFTSKLSPWRPAVVFGFGLIHGLGFARAFAGVGLPRGEFLLGIIGFNVGVECGQLAVIVAAFWAVGWCRRFEWYRRVVVLPGSAAIALVAAFWTVQRIAAWW